MYFQCLLKKIFQKVFEMLKNVTGISMGCQIYHAHFPVSGKLFANDEPKVTNCRFNEGKFCKHYTHLSKTRYFQIFPNKNKTDSYKFINHKELKTSL